MTELSPAEVSDWLLTPEGETWLRNRTTKRIAHFGSIKPTYDAAAVSRPYKPDDQGLISVWCPTGIITVVPDEFPGPTP